MIRMGCVIFLYSSTLEEGLFQEKESCERVGNHQTGSPRAPRANEPSSTALAKDSPAMRSNQLKKNIFGRSSLLSAYFFYSSILFSLVRGSFPFYKTFQHMKMGFSVCLQFGWHFPLSIGQSDVLQRTLYTSIHSFHCVL